MSSFDPNRLSKANGKLPSSAARSERIFLLVEHYETPADGFHYAVGHHADGTEGKIKVRLNTVMERSQDRPNDSLDKIKAQYLTGENTRDSITAKAKANIHFISFDDARKVGVDEKGMTEYRAHWSKTMSTEHSAEVFSGLAHIRLKEAQEFKGQRTPAQAYVELLKWSSELTSENIDKTLLAALSIKDDHNRARDPSAILRVIYEGKVVATTKIFPEGKKAQIFDQNIGQNKDMIVKLDASETLETLMSAKSGRNDYEIRRQDTARAVIAGIKGLDEPKLNTQNEAAQGDIRNLYYGAKSGALQLEVLAAEKIDFGKDSRKTYLSDKDRPQLAVYTMKEPLGDKVRELDGYTRTVIAVHRHEDGEPYAVFASPAEMYPKVRKLMDLPLIPVNEKVHAKSTSIENYPSQKIREEDTSAELSF